MDVIVKMKFGSHLYGTDTSESDTDFKGVFMPSKRDILLQKVAKSINKSTGNDSSKNNKDDVDFELYSIHHFFKLAAEGQTVAFDMLFAPDSCILESSKIWETIVANRDIFISKNTKAFMGYCKTQAAKYGCKGGRIYAIKVFRDFLNEYIEKGHGDKKLAYVWDKLPEIENQSSTYIEPKNNKRMYSLCERKFEETAKINYTVNCLTKIYDNYGHRAKQAELSENIDWKAISHAFRVCFEVLELLESGFITFPLKEATIVKEIKLGKYHYKNDNIDKKLDCLMELVQLAADNSKIQDKVNHKQVTNLLLSIINDNIT